MAKNSRAEKMDSSVESPVKHTPDAEIPDTSKTSELIRSAKNTALVYSNEINARYVAYGFLTVLGLGLGFRFFRRS